MPALHFKEPCPCVYYRDSWVSQCVFDALLIHFQQDDPFANPEDVITDEDYLPLPRPEGDWQ